MKDEERKWVEESIALCKKANEEGVTLAFWRCFTDEPDYAVTNATNAEVLAQLQNGTQPGTVKE